MDWHVSPGPCTGEQINARMRIAAVGRGGGNRVGLPQPGCSFHSPHTLLLFHTCFTPHGQGQSAATMSPWCGEKKNARLRTSHQASPLMLCADGVLEWKRSLGSTSDLFDRVCADKSGCFCIDEGHACWSMRSLCSQQDGGPTPLKVLMVPYTHISTIIDCPFVRQRVGPTIGVCSNSLRPNPPTWPCIRLQ